MSYQKLHRLLLQFLLGLLILNLTVLVTKNLVKQPRPTTILKDYSFPSQHSANAFFVAIFVIQLPFLLGKKQQKQRFLISLGLLLAAAGVAYSRIYINVHYWIDVIFGSIIGASFAIISRRL